MSGMTKKPRMTRVTWITRVPGITDKDVKLSKCEPRSHLISRLSMIVQVTVVLNRIVVVEID